MKRLKISFSISLLKSTFKLTKYPNPSPHRFDNCRRVAEFIVENAWTQKQYVNIYAKLCDFLGRQDKLNFDENKDAKKKKNVYLSNSFKNSPLSSRTLNFKL